MDEVILSIILFLEVSGIVVMAFLLHELFRLSLNTSEIARLLKLNYINIKNMLIFELLRQRDSHIAREDYENAQKCEELIKNIESEIDFITKNKVRL